MISSFQHKENVHKKLRRRKIARRIFVLSLIPVFGLALLIVRDSRTEPVIESQQSGEVRSITKDNDEIEFTEPSYSFKAPLDWVRKGPGDSGKYDTVVFVSGEDSSSARKIEIYEGETPELFESNRLLPISLNAAGTNILPGEMSDRCFTFTTPGDEDRDQDSVPAAQVATWEGVQFKCNFSKIGNVAATGNKESNSATMIFGPETKNTYMFVYTDQTSRPDYTIFTDMLKSFRVK